MAYSVQVRIFSRSGTITLQVLQGDDTPGNVAPSYGLADPLTITQALESGDRGILAHPLPDECSFSLIAASGATYADVGLGDPVAVEVYAQANLTGNAVMFRGRIDDIASQPHDLGVKYDLHCVDYLADLVELPAGTVDYPQELADFRIGRIMAEIGVPVLGLPGGTQVMPARSKSPASALELIVSTLYSSGGTTSWDEYGVSTAIPTSVPSLPQGRQFRYYLVQNTVNGLLDPVTPFSFVFWGAAYPAKRVRYAPPGRLANVAGLWSVTVTAANDSPATGAPIIDGGNVDRSTTYQQVKGGGLPSRTTVIQSDGKSFTWDWEQAFAFDSGSGAYQPLGGLQPAGNVQSALQTVETGFDGSVMTAATAWIGFSDWATPFRPDPRASWGLPGVTWQAWNVANWRRPQLTELLTISRAELVRSPVNREWITGLVAGTVLTVENGRPRLDIQLLPNTLDHNVQAYLQGASNGVCRLDSPALARVRTNLQVNPRPDSGTWNVSTNGWGTAPTATNQPSGAPISGGPYRTFTAVAAFTPGAGSVAMLQQRTLSGVTGTGTKTVTAGEQVTDSLYVRSSIAARVFLLGVLLNATGGVASGAAAPGIQGAAVTLVPNTWTRISFSGTVPLGTDAAILRNDIRLGTGTPAWAVGNTLDFGDSLLESGLTLGSYFDGATAAVGNITYAWTGTANASTSTETTATLLSELSTRDTFADYQIVRGS